MPYKKPLLMIETYAALASMGFLMAAAICAMFDQGPAAMVAAQASTVFVLLAIYERLEPRKEP